MEEIICLSKAEQNEFLTIHNFITSKVKSRITWARYILGINEHVLLWNDESVLTIMIIVMMIKHAHNEQKH